MSVPGVIGDLSDDTQDFPHPLAYRYPTEDAEVVVQDAAWRLTARAMPGRLRSRGGEQAGLDQQTPAGEGADRMAVSVEDYEPLSNLWNDPAARRPASSTRTAATGFKAAAVRLVGLEAIVASLIVLSSFCLAHARGVGFLPQTRAVAERLSIGLVGYVGLGGLALIVVAVLYAVERILRSSPRAGRQEEPADIPQEQVATVGNYLVQAIRERKLSLARSSQIVKAFIVREAYGRRLRADALLPDAAGSLACCLVLLGAPLTIIGLLVPDAGGATSKPLRGDSAPPTSSPATRSSPRRSTPTGRARPSRTSRTGSGAPARRSRAASPAGSPPRRPTSCCCGARPPSSSSSPSP